ncbi:MAG: acetyl-CoA carboxylase biotin carboxyl carrier protein [Burkholderiaceae bacterium]|jgi:acetyl-CoA carboxylase biotin carboxyl carrier protein|nr:acetyl-CoA carboxylase biotin carboxyl carrier protein [Burkholderiaceae bacterium]
MDLRKLKTLIDLVSESNIAELEITEAEGKLRIVKGGTATSAVPASLLIQPPAASVASATPAAALPPSSVTAAASVAPAAAEPSAPAGHAVKSPMIGTLYRAPGPGAVPFVEVGTQVKEGQVLCIIEAMKILNEIQADKSGTVLEVLVENGQAVEYGQPLFMIG